MTISSVLSLSNENRLSIPPVAFSSFGERVGGRDYGKDKNTHMMGKVCVCVCVSVDLPQCSVPS